MEIEEILDSGNVNEILDKARSGSFNSNELMTNDRFKELLYKDFETNGITYGTMRNLVQTVGEENCVNNLDIDKVMSLDSKNPERFFTTLLENGNEAILDKIISQDNYREYFLKNLDKNYTVVGYCSSEKLMTLINKINSQGEYVENMECLTRGLNDEDKKKILNGDYKKEFLISTINNSSNKIVQDFIDNNPKALYTYNDIGVIKLVERDISFPPDIVKQKNFFENLKGNNFVEFRRNINKVYRTSYHPVLENRVKQYEKGMLDDLNVETGTFGAYDLSNTEKLEETLRDKDTYIMDMHAKIEINKYLKEKKEYDSYVQYYNEQLKNKLNLNIDCRDIENIEIDSITDDENVRKTLYKLREVMNVTNKDFYTKKDSIQANLKEITDSKFSEVFVDYTFEDTKKNVRINAKEMIRYNNHLKDDEKVLDKDKEELYSKFTNIDSVPLKEKYELYQNFKGRNMSAEFYKDFSALKNKSYEDICNSLYKTDDNTENISLSDTEVNGVETQKLRGQQFYMLVRVLDSPIKENTMNPHSCYSLISGTNMSIFNNGNSKYTYGYGELRPDMIENVFESDSYTVSQDRNITDRTNRIMTKEEITESNDYYSEINVKNKEIEVNGKKQYAEMKPSYMVCMKKEVSEEVLEESKRIGVPVVMVDKERYKDRRMQQVEYEEYDHDIN